MPVENIIDAPPKNPEYIKPLKGTPPRELDIEEAEYIILTTEGTCKFGDYIHEKDLSLRDFIGRFFELSDSRRTLSESGNPECSAYRNRSIVDLFRTCKYYYPECTLRQVILGLKYWVEEKNDIGGFFCYDIHRFIMRRRSVTLGWSMQPLSAENTEFGAPLRRLFLKAEGKV